MKKITKASWIFCIYILAFWGNANALNSTGADGAFLVNTATIFDASSSQTFNFTSIDVTPTGVLNLSGLQSNQTFTMLATNDINLNGILNIFSNVIFDTTSNINFNGTMNIQNNATVSFSSSGSLNLLGNILYNGVALQASNNPITIKPSLFPPKIVLTPSPVPEPSGYAILMVGVLFLSTLMGRKKMV